MVAIPPSQGKLVYHITHINNMPSILQHGLRSRNNLQQCKLPIISDIADPEIINKRKNYKETLSEYVLFHFFQRNPFDVNVCFNHGSENFALISINRSYCINHNFYIIPSHPLDTDTPDIYPYNEGLQHIRWEILDIPHGRDYNNPEIRKACMAECITKSTVPIEAFGYVYVYNEEAKNTISAFTNSDKITIIVNPFMFHQSVKIK